MDELEIKKKLREMKQKNPFLTILAGLSSEEEKVKVSISKKGDGYKRVEGDGGSFNEALGKAIIMAQKLGWIRNDGANAS